MRKIKTLIRNIRYLMSNDLDRKYWPKPTKEQLSWFSNLKVRPMTDEEIAVKDANNIINKDA